MSVLHPAPCPYQLAPTNVQRGFKCAQSTSSENLPAPENVDSTLADAGFTQATSATYSPKCRGKTFLCSAQNSRKLKRVPPWKKGLSTPCEQNAARVSHTSGHEPIEADPRRPGQKARAEAHNGQRLLADLLEEIDLVVHHPVHDRLRAIDCDRAFLLSRHHASKATTALWLCGRRCCSTRLSIWRCARLLRPHSQLGTRHHTRRRRRHRRACACR